MHDPWTQTTVWGWPEGRGVGAGRRWVKGGGAMGTSAIVSTIKIERKKERMNTLKTKKLFYVVLKMNSP